MSKEVAPSAEDQNGHKIDPSGKLVFDERCQGCDAPKPSAELQKLPVWDKTIDALRMHLQRGFVRNTFDELIVYLRTLEKEHRAMREALEYYKKECFSSACLECNSSSKLATEVLSSLTI